MWQFYLVFIIFDIFLVYFRLGVFFFLLLFVIFAMSFPAFGFDSNWITYCACKFVNIIDNGYCCIEQHDVMKASPWLLLTWLHRASSWLCSPSIFEIWTWSFLRRYVLCETCNFLYGALSRVHRVCWHFFGTYVRPFTHA